MKLKHSTYDAIVIGSGPAGQNAAICAAGNGARTLIVEKELEVGGACVQYGTIPSKTLRETAVNLSSFQRRSGDVYQISNRDDLRIGSLMTRLHDVVAAHQASTRRCLEFAGVESARGHAEFSAPNELTIQNNVGHRTIVRGEHIFVATGSRPRNPPEIPIDHENILDSDSILEMTYLPQSLLVFGGGVIACEYAATFASLGVEVVMVDRHAMPLGFLDSDLVAGFVERLHNNGGQFLGSLKVASVVWDGVSKVVATFECGKTIECDKAFVALGRIANTDCLGLENANIEVTNRGLISVNDHFQTDVPHIYAIGDAIGPPSLASCSMHQGRQAASHAFGVNQKQHRSPTPMGIYTIPEIASVGLDESRAKDDGRDVLVGRVEFDELARGQIMAAMGGHLKLISDIDGIEVLGVQIVGDGATELVHVGQMAIASDMTVDELATVNFNFPTLAEAYRMAALDIIAKRTPCNTPDQNHTERSDERGKAVNAAPATSESAFPNMEVKTAW